MRLEMAKESEEEYIQERKEYEAKQDKPSIIIVLHMNNSPWCKKFVFIYTAVSQELDF